ncbi:MAG TPA: inositol monophosphatase [Acidimicrobiales bacterium]|nr:inositol monophosphatase [Acidimicrobiales bacterium]
MPIDAAELRDCEELAMALADYAVTEMRGRRVLAHERSTKSGPSDWVTVVDIGIEQHVRQELLAAFPGHLIVGEEFGGTADFTVGTPLWYVDPVDGTTNFVHGLPWSSFSLALADDEGLVLGIVADPHRREVFSAVRGRGARVDHEVVSCAGGTDLVGGLVLSELAGTACWPGFTDMVCELSRRECVTRVLGSSALSLASLGAGRATGIVLGGFDPIDVGAGVLIAREGGAVVRTGRAASRVLQASGPRSYDSLGHDLLVAAAPSVVDELVDVLDLVTRSRDAPKS